MKIGIVGGGQLGSMLGLAAYPLGISCHVLDPSDQPPAHPVATHHKAPFQLDAIVSLLSSSTISYNILHPLLFCIYIILITLYYIFTRTLF
jgi:phosphoribosylaminoimidazole carboxylase (NCAIR synthetase)